MTLRNDRYGVPVQAARPNVTSNVAIGASSVQSVPFQVTTTASVGDPDAGPVATPQHTTHVRLVSTSNCWVAFGANPTAASNGSGGSFYMPAATPEYFWVVPGERLAVVQDAAAGTLSVSELAN